MYVDRPYSEVRQSSLNLRYSKLNQNGSSKSTIQMR
jgi:hypothetical protein